MILKVVKVCPICMCGEFTEGEDAEYKCYECEREFECDDLETIEVYE